MSEQQPNTGSYTNFVLHVLFTVLAIVAVTLRFCARRIQKIRLGVSDYIILVALILTFCSVAYNIYSCCGLPHPVPRNAKEAEELEVANLKSQFICPILWVAAVTAVRVSIGALYIRVFPMPAFRIICFIVLGLNGLFFAGTIIADCLICRPIAFRWNHEIDGKCGDQKRLDMFIAVFNLLLDVCMVVLPMPVLWSLQMKKAKKIALILIFGMGTGICALTLYRIYITTTISTTNQSSVYPTIYLLTCLEALLGVINACLPVLKPVYDKAKRTISSSYALLSSGGKIKKGGGSSGGDSATVDVFASPGVRRVAAARRGSTEKILESLDEERMFDMDKTLPASPQVTQVEVVHARGERDIESGVTVGESRLREASEEKRGWW
ncbi:hypothetical protein MMC21_008112 [Puttea exsequens]|nr:hypothetical protein [Puttea exsequens]